MSDVESSQATSRRHITTACARCRESKIKCDGKRPICGICSSKNRDCSYNARMDKRRIPLRRAVEVFSRRVSQLEVCLRQRQIEIPAPILDDSSMLEYLTESYGDSVPITVNDVAPEMPELSQAMSLDRNLTQTSTFEGDGTENTQSDASISTETIKTPMTLSGDMTDQARVGCTTSSTHQLPMDTSIDADFIWYMSTLPSLSADIGDQLAGPLPISLGGENPTTLQDDYGSSDLSTVAPLQENDEDHAEEEDTAEVSHQFSERLGTLLLNSNGEWRFYGATSNLHLVHGDFGHDFPDFSRRKGFQAILDTAGVGHAVDEQLINHLITLYFTWQNPSLRVVDQEAFQTARNEFLLSPREDGLYCEFLVNAMCAVGASFERCKHPELPTPLSDFFANRAKSLLDSQLDKPRLSTIQALAILSTHEGGATRDTRGWLYSGMAMRLAFDLGLHIDPTPYVASGRMSDIEARVRNVTFWGTFATDRMWGFYLGRPFHNTLENVTLKRPSEDSVTHSNTFWTPYGTPVANQQRWPDTQELIAGRWVSLYEIMSELGYKMYCRTDVSKIELQSLAQNTFHELNMWKSTLPPELALNADDLGAGVYLPHTLILHMQHAFCIMILHRPFVAKSYIQPYPRVGAGHEHARSMCVNSAIDIAKLIGGYKLRFSLRRANVLFVHMAFTAALILVYAAVSELENHDRTQVTAHLDVCCQALAELGNVFESASRTLDILLSVKRMWQARLVGSFHRKRPWSES
ncbi:fungal-specific transcription factor domain-containing protein [Fusarium redolens]|uniref:Fungal-specific transcription factor domain-containing protein n=1 Tax=Fusarium redolens TaxID=48865 RepID=A0A9P9JPA6_FUSRE|nr:fungal-specific transcription factor domain-containing protein [Fusarium redolens]KAH7207840.1 fungal-specific transcription factor domain-containing protein [Fusarium redolens]